MGGPGDQKIANEIMASCQVTTAVINLVGQTTIVEAIDLLASADAVVSNDSGLMHIAAATNTPVVGIFGSSSEQHTPPLGDHATSVFNAIDCRPCFARQCPFGHTRCLSEIRAHDVINALSKLLAHSSPQLTI
jgi:heptosyltransferase-2